MDTEKGAGRAQMGFDPAGGGDETVMLVRYPPHIAKEIKDKIVSRGTIEDISKVVIGIRHHQASKIDKAIADWQEVMEYRRYGGAGGLYAALRDSASARPCERK